MTPEERLIYRASEDALNAEKQAAALALSMEHSFRHDAGGGPIAYLIRSAHAHAVEALSQFVYVDVADVESVRKLQNAVQKYSDLALWIGQAASAGSDAFMRLGESDELVDEIRDLIIPKTGDVRG